jgi:hypothetical protein
MRLSDNPIKKKSKLIIKLNTNKLNIEELNCKKLKN